MNLLIRVINYFNIYDNGTFRVCVCVSVHTCMHVHMRQEEGLWYTPSSFCVFTCVCLCVVWYMPSPFQTCACVCVTYTVQRSVTPLLCVTCAPVCEGGCVCILSKKKDVPNAFSSVKFLPPHLCAFEFQVTFLSLIMDCFINISVSSVSSVSFHIFLLPWKKRRSTTRWVGQKRMCVHLFSVVLLLLRGSPGCCTQTRFNWPALKSS